MKAWEIRQVKLLPNLTNVHFDYQLTSRVTNYAHNSDFFFYLFILSDTLTSSFITSLNIDALLALRLRHTERFHSIFVKLHIKAEISRKN